MKYNTIQIINTLDMLSLRELEHVKSALDKLIDREKALQI